MHQHTYQGQTLKHEHDGGNRPHGYYGHEEDKGSPDFGAGTYQYLTPLLDRVTGFMDEQLSRDDMSLQEIAGEVITMVAEDEDQPVYVVTRARIEELAGREVTAEEFARIAKCIEFSTIDECVMGAVEQVTGLPEEDDES